jgi:GT2 family glycosyltransferase
MLGPMVYHADEPEIIQSAGGYFDSQWNGLHTGIDQPDTGQFTTDREVTWLNGCAILCRANVLKAIGGMDETFFLYNEEVDLCMRVKEAGWRIKIVPGAKLWHKGVNRNYQPSPYVTYYMVRNHLYLLKKHNAPLRVKIEAFAAKIRMITSFALRPKWKHKRAHRDAAIQGLIDFLFQRMGKRLE